MSMLETHDHGHDHGHSHRSAPGMFQGHPKTMFFLGLFAGIASCTTLALIFLIGSIASGKGLNFVAAPAVAAPTPAPQVAAQPQAVPDEVPAQPVKPVDEKADHIIGAKNAKVTLIEYSDFECPFCKRHYQTIEDLLKAYPNDVRLVYRHYPLSFHENAMKEAEATECAAELGGNDAFWKYYHKIFTLTQAGGTGFALDKLVPTAKEIGLDEKKFKDCLDSGKYVAKVNQEMAEGAAAGVQGTPGTFVNGKLVEGAQPLSVFKSMIDAELKK